MKKIIIVFAAILMASLTILKDKINIENEIKTEVKIGIEKQK